MNLEFEILYREWLGTDKRDVDKVAEIYKKMCENIEKRLAKLENIA